MSPFLLIDAGNTQVKWAESTPRGAIRLRGRAPTRDLTARRAAALAKKYRRHRVVIASVVPAATKTLRQAFGKRAVFVTAMTSGLSFAYPRPAEIGADRLAAAAAARGPAIIVNCGTATVFNVLDAKGRFCGGVIAPGLGTQLAALLGATAQLPETRLLPVRRALGRSTKTAIQAGAILNFQGGVREILQRLRRELKTSRIIVTGGHARYLKGAALGPMELRPLLVFEGLLIIGQRVFADAV
jgi:type III pantothenate kinase